MRFAMPIYPCEFELPDDWLAEAGWIDGTGRRIFHPTTSAFHSTSNSMLTGTLLSSRAMGRDHGYEKDFRGFDRVC